MGLIEDRRREKREQREAQERLDRVLASKYGDATLTFYKSVDDEKARHLLNEVETLNGGQPYMGTGRLLQLIENERKKASSQDAVNPDWLTEKLRSSTCHVSEE